MAGFGLKPSYRVLLALDRNGSQSPSIRMDLRSSKPRYSADPSAKSCCGISETARREVFFFDLKDDRFRLEPAFNFAWRTRNDVRRSRLLTFAQHCCTPGVHTGPWR